MATAAHHDPESSPAPVLPQVGEVLQVAHRVAFAVVVQRLKTHAHLAALPTAPAVSAGSWRQRLTQFASTQ